MAKNYKTGEFFMPVRLNENNINLSKILKNIPLHFSIIQTLANSCNFLISSNVLSIISLDFVSTGLMTKGDTYGILRETHLTPTIEEHGVCVGGGRQKRTLSFHFGVHKTQKE